MWPFSHAVAAPDSRTAYDFAFTSLTGNQPIPLSGFKGKVLVVVNTASKCGFTGQYSGLQKLYDTYKDRGLIVLGVPSDNFGHQEPGSNDEIAHFCKLNYGVTFPMTIKENITGANAHPFYLWAREKLGFMAAPKWNFHKYLIDRQGELAGYYYSTTAPDDRAFIKAVEDLLARD